MSTAYELDRKHVFHSWSAQAEISPMVITAARGSYVWDDEDRRYLDFSSQLVFTNIGHQHPRVVAAIKEQADRLCTIAPAFANDQRAEAARLISEIDKDLSSVRLKASKKGNVTNVAETEANASSKLETIQSKVRVLLSRLDASEARVRKMRADALAHAKVDSEQVNRLAEYERSIQEMKATVERQQAVIGMGDPLQT